MARQSVTWKVEDLHELLQGPVSVRLDRAGILFKRGRRELTITWGKVFEATTAPTSAPASVFSSLRGKLNWLSEGYRPK